MSVQIKSVILCSFGREVSAWELVMTSGKNSSLLGCREEQRKDGQVPRKCLGTCLEPFSNIWPIGTECLTILQERTNYF